MPIQKKPQLYSGGSHIFRQYGDPYDMRILGLPLFVSAFEPTIGLER
jgi:hypothetical protein